MKVSGGNGDLERRAQEVIGQIELLYSELLDVLGRSRRLDNAELLAWREYIGRHVRNLASWIRAVLTDVGLEQGGSRGECCRGCMEKLYVGDYESCTYVCGYPCYEHVDYGALG